LHRCRKNCIGKTGTIIGLLWGLLSFTQYAILKSQGDYAEAEKWLLEALTIREKVLGKEHRDYSKSLNGLALIYWEMGDFDKAEPLFSGKLNNPGKTGWKRNPRLCILFGQFG
jgi:tetratricopeptide (TPR) repeat protein